MKGVLVGLMHFVLVVGLLSCSSYNVRPNLPPEERIELARLMFKKGDYFEAKSQFRILTLNHPGSPLIDEAQFFLAECHFNLKEYILAADEYSRLSRLYPKSDWVDDAMYKIGVCDFRLSPKPSLDQKYTLQAVQHLQRFIEDYPTSELVPEGEKLLAVCREKLAEKEFKAAELYRKQHSYFAASLYYGTVVDSYYDTRFAMDALYWRAQCLFKLSEFDEAFKAFEEFSTKYPKSEFLSRVKERLKQIEGELLKNRQANGVSPEQKSKN